MKCTQKTILKICLAALVFLGLGFFIFPQFHNALILLIPFAPLAICLAMCPVMMYFGMGSMKKEEGGDKSDKM